MQRLPTLKQQALQDAEREGLDLSKITVNFFGSPEGTKRWYFTSAGVEQRFFTEEEAKLAKARVVKAKTGAKTV